MLPPPDPRAAWTAAAGVFDSRPLDGGPGSGAVVKRLMLVMLLVGMALLGIILYQTNLDEVWSRLQEVGGWGIALVLLFYLLGTVSVSASWLLTLPGMRATPRWLFRLWRAWMVGSFFEIVTPLASLGGEPVKAIVLHRYYDTRYQDATTSLVLARMTDLVAQIIFITAGFALILHGELLPTRYRILVGVGLALFIVGILGFFLLQNKRAFSRLRAWLERGRLRKRLLSGRVVTLLDALHEIEDQLVDYYASQRGRFALSTAAALGEWMSGVFATYVAVNLLGYPITFVEALVIDSFVALVRSVFFFVPADLGTQEGAQVLICSGITGSPELGLALATIRRSRDLLILALGALFGTEYSLRQRGGLQTGAPSEPEIGAAPDAQQQG
jgi:uncharacterized protein (TIRG00374 family)